MNATVIPLPQQIVRKYSSLFPHIEIDDGGNLLLEPNRVKVFFKNPRDDFGDIEGLAESIRVANEQVSPGVVKVLENDPNFDAELVDGERRFRAICLLYKNHGPHWRFRACANTNVTDLKSHFRTSFVANFCKKTHNALEIARGIKQLVEDGHTQAEIATLTGNSKTQTWVSQHLSLLKLIPEAQALLRKDKEKEIKGEYTLPFTFAVRIASYPDNVQREIITRMKDERMPQAKARRFALNIARKSGIPALSRKLKPGEVVQTISSVIETASDNIGVYVDMTQEERQRLFVHMSTPVKKLLVQRLNNLVKDLSDLADEIRK